MENWCVQVFRSHGTKLTVRNLDALPFKVPCEQRENIERSRVDQVSGQIVEPVQNLFGAVRSSPKSPRISLEAVCEYFAVDKYLPYESMQTTPCQLQPQHHPRKTNK